MEKELFNKILKKAMHSTDIKEVLELAQRVAATKNPIYICDFAEMVPLADTSKVMPVLEDGIIACGDDYHMYEFAFCMADSDKKCFDLARFEQLIQTCGNAKIMFYCIECLKGCNTEAMGECLASTGDMKYIKKYVEYLRELGGEENESLASWVEFYSTPVEGEEEEERFLPAHLYHISKYDNSDEGLLYNSIKHAGPFEITLCAEYTNCNKDAALDAMLKAGDLLHLYEFYCCVPDLTEQQQRDILNRIAKSGYAKLMYYLCEWTDLPLEKCLIMQQKIEQTGNEKYIEKVAQTIDRKSGLNA